MLPDLNFKDIPTEELWQRIQDLNEKTTQAPPHIRSQMMRVFNAMVAEYSSRPDRKG
jgi:hypothetical protein